MKLGIAFGCLVLLGPSAATPAATTKIDGATASWFVTFGSPKTDWNNRFIELRDGTLVAGGYVNRDDENPLTSDWDLILRKYRSNGRLLWERRLARKGLDAAWAVRELPDGRLAVGGFSGSGGAGANDMYLAVFRRTGALEWDRWYGGAKEDRATDLLMMQSGGFLLVGQTESEGAGERDVLLVRTDDHGRELWRRAYGTAGVDRGFFAALARDGNIIISGVTGVQGNYDFLLMKVAPDGRLLWRRIVQGGGNDANHGLAVLKDGIIVYAGYGPSWNGRGNDVSLLRFAPDGQLISHQTIGGPGDDRVQFIVADGNSAWMTGYTKSFSGNWRMLIARVEPNGRIEPWLGAVGAKGDMNGSTISLARNGDLLLGGYTSTAGAGQEPPDAFAMRVMPSRIERRTNGVEVRNIALSCHADDEVQTTCR